MRTSDDVRNAQKSSRKTNFIIHLIFAKKQMRGECIELRQFNEIIYFHYSCIQVFLLRSPHLMPIYVQFCL